MVHDRESRQEIQKCSKQFKPNEKYHSPQKSWKIWHIQISEQEQQQTRSMDLRFSRQKSNTLPRNVWKILNLRIISTQRNPFIALQKQPNLLMRTFSARSLAWKLASFIIFAYLWEKMSWHFLFLSNFLAIWNKVFKEQAKTSLNRNLKETDNFMA